MMNWRESTLGDVCELYQPKTISSADLVDGGEYPVYGANGIIGRFDKFNHVEPQLLITCRGATCGSVNISQPNSWINGNAMVVRPRAASVELDYLKHLFKGGLNLSAVITGAAQPQITRQSLAPLKIRFPDPKEQRRIAAILDQADALRAKRREALVQLDSLTQSIFIGMFGAPDLNPKRWPLGKIRDILESASYGTSEKSSFEGEFPVLRMNNITRSGELDLRDLKYMDLPLKHHARYLVKAGDVLFNRTNSAELVGKTAMVPDSAPTLAYAGYLVRLRVNAENHPLYLARFLNTVYAKRMLRGMCKSIIGMANINATEIQAMKIAIPPRQLQQTFATRIETIEALKATHRAALAELDTLFASLQHRAFQREL